MIELLSMLAISETLRKVDKANKTANLWERFFSSKFSFGPRDERYFKIKLRSQVVTYLGLGGFNT